MEEVEEASKTSVGKACGLVLLGALLLAVGADILVGGSVELASRMGISDALIGLTIVAIGTSLPELAASIAAATELTRRRRRGPDLGDAPTIRHSRPPRGPVEAIRSWPPRSSPRTGTPWRAR